MFGDISAKAAHMLSLPKVTSVQQKDSVLLLPLSSI